MPLDRERQPEHVAESPQQPRPQQPHLEREHRAGHGADGEGHAHHLRPAARQPERRLVVVAQTVRVRDQREQRQAEPERHEQDVEPERERHLAARREQVARHRRRIRHARLTICLRPNRRHTSHGEDGSPAKVRNPRSAHDQPGADSPLLLVTGGRPRSQVQSSGRASLRPSKGDRSCVQSRCFRRRRRSGSWTGRRRRSSATDRCGSGCSRSASAGPTTRSPASSTGCRPRASRTSSWGTSRWPRWSRCATARALKPGDLVVTTVRRPCGKPECRPCHHDRPDFCTTGAYTERGIKGRHGFMTDEVIDDDKNMHVVPRSLADIAVLTEPLTIAEKGLLELDSVLTRMPWIDPQKAESRGMNAVVLGAGPVGLLGAMALLVRGFNTWVYSRESRLERSGGLGREGGRPVHLLERSSGRRSVETCRQRRSHLRGDGLGGPRLRGDARDRHQRRSSSSRAFRVARPRCRSTAGRSCATWSSRTRCSTARSTPVLPRSTPPSPIW